MKEINTMNSTPLYPTNQMVFGYQGIVKLKIKIGDKLINLDGHNAGTKNLFNSFAKYLAGYLNYSDIPKYIDLRACADDTSIEEATSILGNLVEVNRTYTPLTDADQHASFIGEINSKNLTPPTKMGLNYYICLVNKIKEDNKDKIITYAYMNIPTQDIEGLFGATGITAIVEWQMKLDNIK